MCDILDKTCSVRPGETMLNNQPHCFKLNVVAFRFILLQNCSFCRLLLVNMILHLCVFMYLGHSCDFIMLFLQGCCSDAEVQQAGRFHTTSQPIQCELPTIPVQIGSHLLRGVSFNESTSDNLKLKTVLRTHSSDR